MEPRPRRRSRAYRQLRRSEFFSRQEKRLGPGTRSLRPEFFAANILRLRGGSGYSGRLFSKTCETLVK